MSLCFFPKPPKAFAVLNTKVGRISSKRSSWYHLHSLDYRLFIGDSWVRLLGCWVELRKSGLFRDYRSKQQNKRVVLPLVSWTRGWFLGASTRLYVQPELLSICQVTKNGLFSSMIISSTFSTQSSPNFTSLTHFDHPPSYNLTHPQHLSCIGNFQRTFLRLIAKANRLTCNLH